MKYSHLHCHTQYSLLDGAADIGKLFKKAVADEMPAIAITDHGNMFGAFEFVAEAAKHKGAVKAIVGCEFYMVEDRHIKQFTKEKKDKRYHQLFLAKNEEGYKNLAKMCSLGFIEGLYSKWPRIDKELVLRYHKGLIATTCCLGAEVPQAILREGEAEAEKKFKWWLDIFGEDYYVELQRHRLPDQEKVNEVLLRFAAKYNVKIICSNDSHYVENEDANAHDILLCVNTGDLQSTPKATDEEGGKGYRFGFPNDQFYFKTTKEMAGVFHDLPQALDNTNEIVGKIDQLQLKRDILLPNFPIEKQFQIHADDVLNQWEYLKHLTYKGGQERYGEVTGAVQERIDFELHTIRTMGFAGYFLIVADFIKAGRDLGVYIGPGRGSAAGSAVAYCTGITNIDPIKYNLLFERFLNPDRKSMPDIDTDFDDEGRQKVIDYVVQKYGKNQVAQIITYGTMAAKSSIKDVSRVMDLPLAEANAMAKLVPEKPGTKLNKIMTAKLEDLDFDPDVMEGIKQLREIHKNTSDPRSRVLTEALKLEGSVRNVGIHAAGIIIAPSDLTDLIPVTVAKDAELLVTQFEGKIIEDAGVIKMDFLGLKNLTIIRDCLAMIKQRHGITLDIETITLEDRATYELYQRAETNGTFQFESPGMQKYLRELKPDKFEDLIAMNALYRPGPLAYIPNFIARKHGREAITYDLPEMEEYLHETYGICITGDTLIHDATTGERVRIDSLGDKVGDFLVQSVDDNLQQKTAKMSYWVCNGLKDVVEMKLQNGSTVKMTANHKVLTEQGWQEIGNLKAGDFVATPRKLDTLSAKKYDRRKLRVLAYLLADGSLSSNGATADFISKNDEMIAEYTRCLEGFERLESRTLQQVREVTRVMVAGVAKTKYHETNSLVQQLRDWGLKTMKGGCTSETKFVPEFVFELSDEDIAFFLASFWDCDGHIGKKMGFIKTISPLLARDIQTLLLRIGIHSTTYTQQYQNNRHDKMMTAYQITIYNIKQFSELIAPHLVAKSVHEDSILSGFENIDGVSRPIFLDEFNTAWTGSKRSFMAEYGLDRQHLMPAKQNTPRIATHIVKPVVEVLEMPQTERNINVRWVPIEHIIAAGQELVYDITVDDTHNFVGNNVLLHNCVYQEQVMLLSQKIGNFSKGDADVLRKAMGKKQIDVLNKMKAKFLEGAATNGLNTKICEKVWGDWEAFAQYAFNKSHSTCYARVAYQTAYLKAHYAAEYMAAILTHSKDLTKIEFALNECRAMGLEVLGPDVNESEMNFTVNKKGQIRFGMSSIKGVGEGPVAEIIIARKDKPFTSIWDLVSVLDSKNMNKRVLEGLIYGGGLDCFGAARAQYFAKSDKYETLIEHALKWGAAVQQQASSNVNSLFGEATESVTSDTPRLPLCDEWGLMDKLQKEKEVVGLYLSGHPLDDYREEIQTFTSCSLPNLDRFRGQEVKVAGIVSEVRHGTTKKGTGWGAFKLQDFEGTIELALFNDDYMKFSHYFVQNQTLFLSAKYMPRWNDNTAYELKLNDVQLLAGLGERLISMITLELNYPDLDERMITDLYMLCTMHPGKHKLRFKLAGLPDNSPVNLSSKTVLVNINDALRAEVKRLGVAYTLA